MNKIISISDDLTGSMAQAILLKEQGIDAEVLVNFKKEDISVKKDALVINIDSRGHSSEYVKDRLGNLLHKCAPDFYFSKRIDTTLRGHLLLEIEMVLEFKTESIALVVPAYPSSGRITIHGHQFLNGIPLERTEVSNDPLWPIRNSFVADYFKGKFQVGSIEIEDIKKGPETILKKCQELCIKNRIIIMDTETINDIKNIATACISLKKDIIPVDPGIFTAHYFSQILRHKTSGFILAIIGTLAEKTMRQLEFLKKHVKVHVFDLDVNTLDDNNLNEKFALFNRENLQTPFDVLVLKIKGPLLKGKQSTVSAALAKLSALYLKMYKKSIKGIFVSGGDTAISLFRLLHIELIKPEEEIIPLMVGGIISEGGLEGLKVVTKGGLVGEKDALYKAINWLK